MTLDELESRISNLYASKEWIYCKMRSGETKKLDPVSAVKMVHSGEVVGVEPRGGISNLLAALFDE